MKKIIIAFAFLCFSINTIAQVSYTEIRDANGEKRQIKVQLPRNYTANTDKSYPVIVVLDGDYLFEPVAGTVDYYSYWDEMPETIVVGLNQYGKKMDDFFLDEISGLPTEFGETFMNFVTYELFNFIDNNYRTVPQRTIIGHGESANYINYYLLQQQPFFRTYISLSPNLSVNMEKYLTDRLNQNTGLNEDVFYSLTTSENDRKKNKKKIIALNKKLESVTDSLFHYNYNFYKGKTHYELVSHAIPEAIESVYKTFKPIDRKEYKEKVLTYENGTAYDYLVKKYDDIKRLYGIKKRIRLNDFNAAEAALRKNEEWEVFELLSKLAQQQYPETMLGLYYKGLFYEKSEEDPKPKKAMKAYMSAYTMKEIGNLTKDGMLERAEQIKADFGYK